MLDQQTKKRIDDCRNILVGKITDPKSQVEQITIALIYKFMDDMDTEAMEMGGVPTYFVGEYEKYSWKNLFSPRIGSLEMLSLYGEGMVKMNLNPNLPQLFRDIFKNAFLPYRDPETLKLFLKSINGFEYDHSERLGDSFEYLLSVLGSQGDAGQFRTPRHIIDFVVDLVDPKKNETILDPACGTSGFLISSYKHILSQNTDKKNGDKLTPTERKKLVQNISGYDISPDMVRLSLVNLFLHGFTNPQIYEYDTLTSEDRWNEYYDVIIANPPFMTPKGGIRPHKKFSIQATKSELLFTDYIVEHIKPNTGRTAIIIPEGIIFNTKTAYKNLRKILIDNGLYGVVSLPKGVFNPYSDIKTYILLVDKVISKKSDNIFFVRIDNDGYDLGTQRRPIEDNDLPFVSNIIKDYKTSLLTDSKKNFNNIDEKITLVSKDEISNNQYILTSEKYNIKKDNRKSKFEMVELSEIIDYEQPTKYIVNDVNYNDDFETPVLTAGKTFILGYTNETTGIFKDKLPVIIFDDFTTSTKYVDFPFKVKSSAMKILHIDPKRVNVKYIYYLIKTIKFNSSEHKRYWISEFSKIKVPLPPLEVQNKIVEKLKENESEISKMNEKIKQIEIEQIKMVEEVWG